MNYFHLLPVREFPDRGTKWLLESPENTRELLRIIAAELVEKLDFKRIQYIPTTFIPDNLRKQEADILFLIPFVEGGTEREVLIYILIEHQSTPSLLMGFRITFYMLQIWDRQRRAWIDQKLPEEQWRFHPILPIVFYTGAAEWETSLKISALMDVPYELESYVPHHETLFLHLKETAPEKLTPGEHPFGWVLRVIQKEAATQAEFVEALLTAIDRLESLPPEEAETWEKLMYYLFLLIYHRRAPSEHEMLRQQVQERVRTHFRKEEVENMGQTIAQALIQEGQEIGALQNEQRVLINLLTKKFGQLPSNIVERIQRISEIARLDTLLNHFVTAKSLDDIKIE